MKYAPLATRGPKGKPILTHPQWPVTVQDAAAAPQPAAVFMVSYAYREEKGSDVNIAAHVLVDVLTHEVEAAIVISNDSDLSFALNQVRQLVPLGTLHPGRKHTATALKGGATAGAGGHWWRQLTLCDFTAHQLPGRTLAPRVGSLRCVARH